MDSQLFYIDPAHPTIDELVASDPIMLDVFNEKYRRGEEKTINDTFLRVAGAIAKNDDSQTPVFYEAMASGLWMPGGRILAGAGTDNIVTLMNCYVSPDIPDDMAGIADALKVAMLTQQQGGGIGMDFSTLRPNGALLRRTGSRASGPIPFMHQWDAMCETIRSAGDRRGAMMGTLCDTHPDLFDFIKAKHTKGKLTNFNLSVLVSDAFMGAVEDDEDWDLYFNVPPYLRDVRSFVDDDGVAQYVYATHKARYIWDAITASTYVYSEPGIIFIDRINDLNNLKYCEHIHCTNPCGEQPLPANGTCNLGAVNLSRMVRHPFTDRAIFDFDLLRRVVAVGQRFLDNVIDVTIYPVEAQAQEEAQKRRTGLGVSGLASALAQLRVRYGSGHAIAVTREIMKTLMLTSYETSMHLAKERGSFPLFDESQFFNGFAGQKLPPNLIDDIHKNGIRNGVLNTIAPTGTTSIVFGNVEAGVEPAFQHVFKRKVRQGNSNDSWKEYDCRGYTAYLFEKVTRDYNLSIYPDYMPTTDDLTVEEHIRMQAACQEYIDASVSKTANCPEDISFETFQEVYSLAYEKGCKGCTTYRPSDIRGSILSTSSDQRPDNLPGTTYKIKWPSWSSAIYVTINSFKNKPYEVFISSKDARHQEWIIALSVLISRILRKADDPMKIIDELKQIQSTHDWALIGKKRYGSLLGKIAEVLEDHLAKTTDGTEGSSTTGVSNAPPKDMCPKCMAVMLRREGCSICPSCSHSTCG